MMNEAILSNNAEYTIFSYGDYCIRFKAPYSLERYIAVKTWEEGYLVVLAKYKHSEELEEEYIDLVPILEHLFIDKNNFLHPIKKVRISYDEAQGDC